MPLIRHRGSSLLRIIHIAARQVYAGPQGMYDYVRRMH
jgi:hypothetical protein